METQIVGCVQHNIFKRYQCMQIRVFWSCSANTLAIYTNAANKSGIVLFIFKIKCTKTINRDLSVPLVKLFQSTLTHTPTGFKSQVLITIPQIFISKIQTSNPDKFAF